MNAKDAFRLTNRTKDKELKKVEKWKDKIMKRIKKRAEQGYTYEYVSFELYYEEEVELLKGLLEELGYNVSYHYNTLDSSYDMTIDWVPQEEKNYEENKAQFDRDIKGMDKIIYTYKAHELDFFPQCEFLYRDRKSGTIYDTSGKDVTDTYKDKIKSKETREEQQK